MIYFKPFINRHSSLVTPFIQRWFAVVMLIILPLGNQLRADEGMWLLPLIDKLNIHVMKEKGFQLSAEDIYSINHSSMKDAVVIFANGCTGELVSDQGLILTNHHCGYSQIQELSTIEHNYLEDGYWAKTKDDELHAPGLTVTFLKRMEDVTDSALVNVTPTMDEHQRSSAISKKIRQIEKEASSDSHLIAKVKSFFGGNQYFLVVYEEFKDVRLVGAPPSSIGKFGHDTDNWMWPRHNGDFSIFRVYADSTGKSAEYSPKNKPYKPASYFPVSLKGYQEGDFAMTLGNPGNTERYLCSWGISERMNVVNHSRIKPRGVKQEIWLEDMLANPRINLQYASKYSRSSNYWKNSIGMNLGLNKLKVLDQKRALEAQFTNWVKADSARTLLYGNVLDSLQKLYTGREALIKSRNFLIECLLRGTELPYFATNAGDLKKALEKKDAKAIEIAVTELRELSHSYYKDYSLSTDRKVFVALASLYYNDIDPAYHPTFFADVKRKYKGDFSKYADDLFGHSIFADSSRFEAFLSKPSLKTLNADPIFVVGNSIVDTYLTIGQLSSESSQDVNHYTRMFQAGLMQMQSDKVFYPDANFTMRMSYGTVGGYKARDAVYYNYFTTLRGVMEKEDSTNWEFVVSPKLKQLYLNRDYGRYADKSGEMNVCFISNNDITGGNSGSPVINAHGELIGLAFDGNWEAMSGDIAFENDLQKCINVDIRYVLFIIDKYAGASHLIDEMTIR